MACRCHDSLRTSALYISSPAFRCSSVPDAAVHGARSDSSQLVSFAESAIFRPALSAFRVRVHQLLQGNHSDRCGGISLVQTASLAAASSVRRCFLHRIHSVSSDVRHPVHLDGSLRTPFPAIGWMRKRAPVRGSAVVWIQNDFLGALFGFTFTIHSDARPIVWTTYAVPRSRDRDRHCRGWQLDGLIQRRPISSHTPPIRVSEGSAT